MDYILFGMGFGASLMLIGWALRTFGPGWKYAAVTSDEDPEMYVRKRFWNRFVQGLGGVLAIAGTSTVLLTFLVMLSNPDDDTGTMFSLVLWLFVSLIVLGWCLTYLSHYGCTGIWSRDEGYGFGANPPRSGSTRQTFRMRGAPNVVVSIPAATVLETTVSETTACEEETVPSEIAAEELTLVESEGEIETDIDPEYDFGNAEDTTVPAAQEDHAAN